MPAGRPSDYEPEFCKTAHAMAQQGATDREIAAALGISETSFYRYCNAHPEFRQAVQLGKESADDRVERSLYHRAVGYSFDAVKIMQSNGEVLVEPYVEHVPPDIGAIKFWLTNRRGDKWRERQNVDLTLNRSPVDLEDKALAGIVASGSGSGASGETDGPEGSA